MITIRGRNNLAPEWRRYRGLTAEVDGKRTGEGGGKKTRQQKTQNPSATEEPWQVHHIFSKLQGKSTRKVILGDHNHERARYLNILVLHRCSCVFIRPNLILPVWDQSSFFFEFLFRLCIKSHISKSGYHSTCNRHFSLRWSWIFHQCFCTFTTSFIIGYAMSSISPRMHLWDAGWKTSCTSGGSDIWTLF